MSEMVYILVLLIILTEFLVEINKKRITALSSQLKRLSFNCVEGDRLLVRLMLLL